MSSVKFLPEFSQDFIRKEADRCVSCGLCLPHCPTYYLTKSEADSPRGRIALMNGVVNERIPMNERFIQHMDRCLTCRACELVCPNNVAYGKLIDETRVMIAASSFTPLSKRPDLTGNKSRAIKKKSRLRILAEKEIISKPARFDSLRPLFRFFQKSGLPQWLQKSRQLRKIKLAKLITQLPPVGLPYSASGNNKKTTQGKWQEIYPAVGTVRGEVGLFLGCVARLVDVATLNSAIYILNRLGYTVSVPPDQTCCGALHQHSGETRMAAQLAQQNKMAFEGYNLDTIISTVSGCGVQLVESGHAYGRKGSNESASVSRNSKDNHVVSGSEESKKMKHLNSITDISKFLAVADGWEDIEIQPLPYKIAVHEPCSLRNVLRDEAYPYALIARIPQAEVISLKGNSQCCGAAGTYFLDQPDLAEKLLNDKVSAVLDSRVRYLVTSNIGCSLHIANGLREIGSDVELLHPVTLLARQMGIQ